MTAAPLALFRTGKGPSPLGNLLGRFPRLLVFDFDGTLSHLAATPDKAVLTDGAKKSLERLAASPNTTVSVLSGRSLKDVESKINLPGLICFGSHGLTSNRKDLAMAEKDLAFWTDKARETGKLLAPLVLLYPGCLLEHKGPDVCLHYRGVNAGLVPELLREARSKLEGLPLSIREGKGVLEARPPETGKGDAVLKLLKTVLPSFPEEGFCLYAGDDLTDEDAFSALLPFGGKACTVKVGDGETTARFRLEGVEETERLLAILAGEPPPAHETLRTDRRIEE